MRWPSLSELFDLMILQGARAAAEASAETPDSPLVPMSVRVSSQTRAYFEAQAKACGAPSASAMVAMALEGIKAATRHMEDRSSTDCVRDGVVLVRERFLHLFQVHGFAPPMIADALSTHGIDLADIMDDTKLFSRLSDDDVLVEQARRFGVSQEWLYGKAVRPLNRIGEFHKTPARFCRRVAEMLREADYNTDLTVLFLRRRGARLEKAFENDRDRSESVGIVVRQNHRTPKGTPFHHYAAWQAVPWGYDQSRLSVKAIILWLERLRHVTFIYKARFEGLEVDDRVLSSVCSGGTIPAEALQERDSRLPRWDPDDYVAQSHRNSGAKEVSERALALEYYKLWKMDDEFRVLDPLNTELLAREIE